MTFIALAKHGGILLLYYDNKSTMFTPKNKRC